MAFANSSITDIIATTIQSRSGELADNLTNNNALLSALQEQGNIKTFSGGNVILEEIMYNDTATDNSNSYSGYEAINISPDSPISAAQYSIKQYADAVSMSGLEMLQNSGKEATINLLEGRIKNAERTLTNNIALDCYSDGTGSGGRQIGGLAYIIDSTPSTGTVGGIDASQTIAAFWRNIAFSGVTNGGAAVSSSNIQSYMNQVWVQLVRGADAPDLIVADNIYWRYYLESLQAIQRIASDEMAQAGFSTLKYMNADVVLDGGVGGGATASTMNFINTNYLFLRPHVDRNFAPLESERFAVNQDAMVKLIGFAGNMTCSNRRLQGILFA